MNFTKYLWSKQIKTKQSAHQQSGRFFLFCFVLLFVFFVLFCFWRSTHCRASMTPEKKVHSSQEEQIQKFQVHCFNFKQSRVIHLFRFYFSPKDTRFLRNRDRVWKRKGDYGSRWLSKDKNLSISNGSIVSNTVLRLQGNRLYGRENNTTEKKESKNYRQLKWDLKRETADIHRRQTEQI